MVSPMANLMLWRRSLSTQTESKRARCVDIVRKDLSLFVRDDKPVVSENFGQTVVFLGCQRVILTLRLHGRIHSCCVFRLIQILPISSAGSNGRRTLLKRRARKTGR